VRQQGYRLCDVSLRNELGGRVQRASRSKTTGWHIALLRGINVSGRNMLPMAELAKIFAAGCGDVKTYIQSGNVVFCADDGIVDKLAGLITQQIEERFGCKVPVVLRTAAELGEVVRSNPFLKAGGGGGFAARLFSCRDTGDGRCGGA